MEIQSLPFLSQFYSSASTCIWEGDFWSGSRDHQDTDTQGKTRVWNPGQVEPANSPHCGPRGHLGPISFRALLPHVTHEYSFRHDRLLRGCLSEQLNAEVPEGTDHIASLPLWQISVIRPNSMLHFAPFLSTPLELNALNLTFYLIFLQTSSYFEHFSTMYHSMLHLGSFFVRPNPQLNPTTNSWDPRLNTI